MFKTQRISLSILSLAFTFVLNGQAEEKKLAKETTYNINSSNTSVSTIVRDNTAKLKLIEKYLFKEVAEALKKMPQVSNVVFVPGEETKQDYSWADYTTKKRESFAYVNLDMGSQVSLLFKVNEELRECKAQVEKKQEVSEDEFDDWTGESSGCDIHSLKSEITIHGPVSVYGTFASNIDINNLLKDRQSLTISVQTNYSEEFEMKSSFNILSSSFEENLMKFFEAFQVRPMIGTNFTRRQLLVGVARAMRNINERVLEL